MKSTEELLLREIHERMRCVAKCFYDGCVNAAAIESGIVLGMIEIYFSENYGQTNPQDQKDG